MNTPRVPIDELLAHRGFVRALARRLAADDARADDVEQNAWLAAIERPPRDDRGLRAWLARLVSHRASDARRAEVRRARAEGAVRAAAAAPSPVETAARMDAVRRVIDAVIRLPEPYRTTIVLRFYDDLSVAEIAERMTVPAATVRTRLARAYARLRAELGVSEDSRNEWIAMVAPWPRNRWSRRIGVTTGALVMSVKLWVGAGVTAALLVAAILFSPRAEPPHRTMTSRAVDAPVAARPREKEPAVATKPTSPPDAVAATTEPTGTLLVEARTFRDEPVAGAVVEVRRFAPDTPTMDARQTSGADGIARFPCLPGGSWSVVAHADAFAEANRSVVVSARSGRRLTLYLDRGHELRGTVRDSSGAPVPFASVDWVRPRPRPVVADATGGFVLSGLPTGEIQLRAGRSADLLGHVAFLRVPDVSMFDIVLVDFPVVTTTGSVVDDASGAPIEGVVVGCAVAGPPPCTTDADGRFRVAGVGSHFLELITLTKVGYRRFPAARPAAVDPPSGGVVDIGVLRMRHGATIEGVVTSPEGPIEGAEVIVTSPSRLTGSERRTARTDAAGRYSFPSVEAGPTQIWATAPGFIAGETRVRSGQLQAPESGAFRADFAFTRGAVVEGRVQGGDGYGVPGAYVVVDGVMATTDADGAFRCAGLVPRAGVPVLIMADGWTRSDSALDVGPGTTSNIVLRLSRSPIVRGRLVARDGRATENARVQVVSGKSRDPARISADDLPDGAFPVLDDGSFEARVPGSATAMFTVVAWTTSHAPSCSEPVPIVAGQREYDGVEVALDAGLTVRGRVLADGRGAAGAAVRIGFAGYGYSTPPIRAATDAAGAFTIDHVGASLDGRIYVTATLAGYLDAIASPASDAAGDVALVLEKPLEISGVVETPDHAGIRGVDVRAFALAARDVGPVPPSHFAFSDALGHFRIQGLRTGKYRVTATRSGAPPVEMASIDAGAHDVAIVVER